METEEQTIEQDLGPRKIGNSKLFSKTLMGILGGLGGTLIIFITMMLSYSVLPTLFSGAFSSDSPTGINPVLLFIVFVMVFLATLVGNLLAIVLFHIVDREKYAKLTTNLTQAFIFNLLIFVFSIPLYLIVQSFTVTTLTYIITIHFLLSAFISSLVLELLSKSEYVLVSLYGNTFAVLAAMVINVILFLSAPDSAKAFFIFLTMPLTWGAIGFFDSLTEMVYRWSYDVYGIDFLNREAQYEEEEKGSEEGDEEQEEL